MSHKKKKKKRKDWYYFTEGVSFLLLALTRVIGLVELYKSYIDRNLIFLCHKIWSSSSFKLVLLGKINSPILVEDTSTASHLLPCSAAFPSSSFSSSTLLLLVWSWSPLESPLNCISCSATSISDSENSMPFWFWFCFWVLLFLHVDVDFAISSPLRNKDFWETIINTWSLLLLLSQQKKKKGSLLLLYIENKLGRLPYFIIKIFFFFFINIILSWPVKMPFFSCFVS